MIKACSICQHAKRHAIDADLDKAVPPHRMALKYRLKKADLLAHVPHLRKPHETCMPTHPVAAHEANPVPLNPYRSLNTQQNCIPSAVCSGDHLMVTDSPMGQFKQHLGPLAEAYHRADDLTMRDRMRFLLNEALQADEMGL